EHRGQRTPSGQRAGPNKARHAASERNLSSRPGSVQSFMTTIYRTPPAHQNPVRQGNNSGDLYRALLDLAGPGEQDRAELVRGLGLWDPRENFVTPVHRRAGPDHASVRRAAGCSGACSAVSVPPSAAIAAVRTDGSEWERSSAMSATVRCGRTRSARSRSRRTRFCRPKSQSRRCRNNSLQSSMPSDARSIAASLSLLRTAAVRIAFLTTASRRSRSDETTKRNAWPLRNDQRLITPACSRAHSIGAFGCARIRARNSSETSALLYSTDKTSSGVSG